MTLYPSIRVDCVPVSALKEHRQMLLDKCATKVAKVPFHATLHSLCDSSNVDAEAVRALLNNGAGVNDQDKHGWTALMYAAVLGHSNVVKLLLNAGADATMQTHRSKMTALALVCGGDYPFVTDIVELLIQSGSPLNAHDAYGRTPLMLASVRGYLDVLRVLIKRGADVSLTNIVGKTALALVSNGEYPFYDDVVELLLKAGSPVDTQDHFGFTPLMSCCENSYSKRIVNYLVRAGANLNLTDNYGRTALMIACLSPFSPSKEIITTLIQEGAQVNLKSHHARTVQQVLASLFSTTHQQ